MRLVMADHMANSTSAPTVFTVFTEVCTISGAAELLGRRQDGLHRQVVDDVDRRDAVAVRERLLDDLLGWHDRHYAPPPLRRTAEIEDRARVVLVHDEDVDDPGPQHAQDRARLLRPAHDGHDGLDAPQVVDRQRDQPAAVRRRDERPSTST